MPNRRHGIFYLYEHLWQEICAINAQAATQTKQQLKWFFQCDLWSLSNSRAQEALWHFGGQCGARGCQNCQNCQTVKTAKCVKKMCKAQNVQKQHFPGVSQQSSCPGLCQSVVPASPGLFRSRGLIQPSPAFSSWLQPGQGLGALPSCPEAQGECLSFRELPREVTGPRSLDSAHIHLQPIATVPRLKNYIFTVSENTLKNSKLNILFLFFDI